MNFEAPALSLLLGRPPWSRAGFCPLCTPMLACLRGSRLEPSTELNWSTIEREVGDLAGAQMPRPYFRRQRKAVTQRSFSSGVSHSRSKVRPGVTTEKQQSGRLMREALRVNTSVVAPSSTSVMRATSRLSCEAERRGFAPASAHTTRAQSSVTATTRLCG